MITDTYNFDSMSDTDWIKLVGKPVVIGTYLKATDDSINQFIGNLVNIVVNPDQTKFTVSGDKSGWFNPKLAYALISFQRD